MMDAMDPDNPTGLLRIEAPHYVAACEWENGHCIKAAPILWWMLGKSWAYIHRWLFHNRYHWQWVENHESR